MKLCRLEKALVVGGKKRTFKEKRQEKRMASENANMVFLHTSYLVRGLREKFESPIIIPVGTGVLLTHSFSFALGLY